MNERQKAFAYQLLDERLSTFLINGQHDEAIQLLCDAALSDIIDVYFYMSLLAVFRSVCTSGKSKAAEQDSNIPPRCRECKKMEKESCITRYGVKCVLTQGMLDEIATYMDDNLREYLYVRLAPCPPAVFLREYLRLHPSFAELLSYEFGIELE